MEALSRNAKPEWWPDITISGSTQYLGVKPYGMDRFDQLFTDRQLLALTTFADLVREVRERVEDAALANGLPRGRQRPRCWRYWRYRLCRGGRGLLRVRGKQLVDRMTTICTWDAGGATWGRKLETPSLGKRSRCPGISLK